ncbi:MAG: 4Fe-4S binding protein [Syntrophobacteraceae bacterium]|jgi:Pyruvate/2-oxoacid:ferredoxin oxidoreductase delta subunit
MAMIQNVYKEMLEVMAKRGGPFTGVDVPEFYTLMEALFTPEEAELNNVLARKPATAQDIAGRINRDEKEVTGVLERMVDKGLCLVLQGDGAPLYQGIPFMPGIFEYQFISGGETEHNKKIAELIHAYEKACESVKGPEKISYPVTRVIPVARTIKAGNVIHTYDQVMTYIDKYDSIGVGTCYCRQAAKLRGEDTHGMPLEVCMWFGERAEHLVQRLGGRRITKQEAKDILDSCEEAGLLHMSRNTTEDIDFMCNCDRYHCGVVTNVLKQPKPALVFNSGFQPVFDSELCVSCETCIERCPPQALAMDENNVQVLNTDLCFGCGMCATGCPEGAVSMEAKPGFPVPPKTTKDLVAALRSCAEGKS